MSRFICLGVAAMAASLTLGFSGCCSSGCNSGGGGGGALWGFVDHFMQRQVACMQEKVWAKRAFHLRYGHCERVHADHFREGFVNGYCGVCSGDGAEVPALPPEKYWGFQYRNQEGAEMQTAWFQGFEAGTQSARTDGSGSFQDIQISRQLEQAMLAADAIEDQHSGIERGYAVGLAPVVGSGLPQSRPQTNMPYTNGPVITSINGVPQSNTPFAQPVTVPSIQTGAGSNMPMPIQSAPPVPIVPGS